MNRELTSDVVVVGGGLGGVAAAWAIADAGFNVILTEETDWLGGQLTVQGVPPDDHPWIETVGATRRYRELRSSIRNFYRSSYPLRPESAVLPNLNPGAGGVSGLCHEPRVAAVVIDCLLEQHVQSGRLTVLRGHRIVGAELAPEDVLAAVVLEESGSGDTVTASAPYFLDATETGELLPLAGIEHVTGAESSADTGEPLAPEVAQPLNMQAVSWCFAVEHRAGEDHTIDKPERYDYWRNAEPSYWHGPQFGWTAPHPHTGEPRHHTFTPNPDDEPARIWADQSRNSGADELWNFRRIRARNHFTPGAYDSDITLVNWPMIDYLDGPIFGEGEALARRHLDGAREMSTAFLYWMQTEAPRADGGAGFPGLRLSPEVMGTSDGFAKGVYVRESRRILAERRVTTADLSVAERGPNGAISYQDSVGVGAYRIDLHPSTGGDNYIDVPAYPFEVPLGALLPVRVRNVVAAAKNIGTTHITNGCYRLHPVEWNIGESAGALVAHCLRTGVSPHDVRAHRSELEEFQHALDIHGVQIRWPRIAPW